MIDIKKHLGYNPLNTKYIAVHHTGGLGNDQMAMTQHLTAENIDTAHMQRFDMLSTMRRWGGYNFFIEKDGKITQFRALGEETAAVKGYNFNGLCISICLAGNFTKGVESPTAAQVDALRRLCVLLPKVEAHNIVPHRFLQQTACYGPDLADDWARKILAGAGPVKNDENEIAELMVKITLLTRLIELYRQMKAKLGSAILGAVVLPDCSLTDPRG